jgi:hypothetical protein
LRNPTVYTCPPATWIAREGAGLIGDDAELLRPAPPELLRPAPSKPLRISLPKLLWARPAWYVHNAAQGDIPPAYLFAAKRHEADEPKTQSARSAPPKNQP